jgi:hypothetical protein
VSLNEHVTCAKWPPADERQGMLDGGEADESGCTQSTASAGLAIGTDCVVNFVRAAQRIVHAVYGRASLSIGSDHTIHLPIGFDHKIQTIRAPKWSEPIGRRKNGQK